MIRFQGAWMAGLSAAILCGCGEHRSATCRIEAASVEVCIAYSPRWPYPPRMTKFFWPVENLAGSSYLQDVPRPLVLKIEDSDIREVGYLTLRQGSVQIHGDALLLLAESEAREGVRVGQAMNGSFPLDIYKVQSANAQAKE